jgi:hypothetical protein
MSIFITGLSKAGVREGRRLVAKGALGNDHWSLLSNLRAAGEERTPSVSMFRESRTGGERRRRVVAVAGKVEPAFAAACHRLNCAAMRNGRPE